MNIEQYSPQSGRFLKEDGTYINIADALGGTETGQIADIEKHAAHSGRFIKEDGTVINIAESIGSGGGGGGSSDDSAPPIIETYNGQTIQCSMSIDRPIKGLNLYATCEQATTTGAQLFDLSTVTAGVLNAAGGIDTVEWYKTSDFIPVESSAQYVSNSDSAYIKFYNSDKAPVQTESIDVNTSTTSFTTGETTAFIRYSYNLSTVNPSKLIIAKGSSLPDYEPYTGGIPSPNGDYPQEIQTISDFVVEVKNSMEEGAMPQTLDITIPEQGFYGIPVSSGGNYTDSSGQRWICDEFDFANKKFIKRVGRVSFDGSEDEVWSSSAVGENYRQFGAVLSNGYKGALECLCNKFIYGLSAQGLGSCSVWNSLFYIRVEPSINTVALLRDYLKTHQLDVIYPFETPVEYDLTDEQVEQYKKLRSYYGTTYIENDAVPACNMQAELVLDTKLYIDNKFTTLAGQILEMGV